jgi:trehalose 6-phosphate phosphatase
VTDAPIWVTRAAAEYAAGRPLLLLFDYDGTLTPIVAHPSLAKLPAASRGLLRRFAALPNVAVGAISGRAMGDLRDLVAVDGIYYAGSGGLELDLHGEPRSYPVGHLAPLFTAVHTQFDSVLGRHPGTWVERKPGALSVHYRALSPEGAVAFLADAAEILTDHAKLRWRVVSESVEVTPADGWDKGTAVAATREHAAARLGTDPLPLFFGDAQNDTEAMLAVNEAGGESIGIGTDAPAAAKHKHADPAELAAALTELAERLTNN